VLLLLLLLSLLLGLCLPAAVDVDAMPQILTFSPNHDVYRFCRAWSCLEGQANVKKMLLSSPHCTVGR
jgi:hypothetical protein